MEIELANYRKDNFNALKTDARRNYAQIIPILRVHYKNRKCKYNETISLDLCILIFPRSLYCLNSNNFI
jgi:hypothetical protein